MVQQRYLTGPRLLGTLGSVLLVIGSYAYNRLPDQTWNTRWALLRWWRHLAWAEGIGMAISAAGLVLLTVAWLLLLRRVRGRSYAVADVVLTAFMWALPLFLAGPVFSGDGWSYVATGYLTGHGYDPYHVGVDILPVPLHSGVSPAWLATPTPYGPLPLVWGALFSRLTSDPWLLLGAYRLLALLSLLALAWGVQRIARRQGADPAVAVALACASPFVIAHGIGGLHNDMVVIALGVAALAVTGEGRWWWPAVLVGAAAAVKIPGGLFAVGVVLASLPAGASWVSRLVRTAQVGVVAGAVLVAAGLPYGLGLGWFSALSVPDSGRVHLAVVAMAAGVVRSLAQALDLHAVASAFSSAHAAHAATVLALGVCAVVLVRWRTGADRRVLAGAGVAMVAVTVLSPVVHYWYFLWCVPLLCALNLPRRWAGVLLAELVGLGLTAVCDPAFRVGWMSALGGIGVLVVPVVAYVSLRNQPSALVTDE